MRTLILAAAIIFAPHSAFVQKAVVQDFSSECSYYDSIDECVRAKYANGYYNGHERAIDDAKDRCSEIVSDDDDTQQTTQQKCEDAVEEAR
jgi:hypothetical protein